MSDYIKYLKYKRKYLDLIEKQAGGGHVTAITISNNITINPSIFSLDLFKKHIITMTNSLDISNDKVQVQIQIYPSNLTILKEIDKIPTLKEILILLCNNSKVYINIKKNVNKPELTLTIFVDEELNLLTKLVQQPNVIIKMDNRKITCFTSEFTISHK